MSLFTNPSELWDRYVEEYAQQTGPKGPFLGRLLTLADSIRPFSTATAILDDGCGVANVTATLIADHGSTLPKGVRLIASDYSKGMISYVEKLKNSQENESNHLWQSLETYVLDAQDLSSIIPPSSLSHIMSNLVFMAIEDAPKPIIAAYDALESGGALSFTIMASAEWIEIWEYARELAPIANWNLKGPEPWGSLENIEKMLREAGFPHIQGEEIVIPMRHTPETLRPFVRSWISGNNPLAARVFGTLSAKDLDKAVDLIVEGTVKEKGETIVLSGRVQIFGAKK